MTNLIVFTDLDGTLLDHTSYSYDDAIPALIQLKKAKIPLILASSKTAAELLSLRNELGFENCPAIVENGAGILPAHSKKTSEDGAEEYNHIIGILSATPYALRKFYNGFNDWTVDQISKITNLPKNQAILAAQRQFSEPGLWSGDDNTKQEFINYLKENGVLARIGGRFMTLSLGATKGQRITQIIQQYDQPITSLSLGDAPNDIEMLENTDFGIIIANDHGADIPPLSGEATNHIIRSNKHGPSGWNEAVLNFLSMHIGSIPRSHSPKNKTESEKNIG